MMLVSTMSLACSSSTSAASGTTGSSPISSSPSSSIATPTWTPPPASIKKGDLFPVRSVQGWEGRFTTQKDAQGLANLTIDIVAVGDRPGFQPAVITGSPGQMLQVTVYQAGDLSSHFQHNFSIDQLHIDKDIPKGSGHSISETVTLPMSGSLTFYCSYHVAAEQHAGEFLIAK